MFKTHSDNMFYVKIVYFIKYFFNFTIIIVQRIMDEHKSPVQNPERYIFNFKPKKQPSGIEMPQYAIKFDIIMILVCFIPLHIPDNEICNPSKI